MAHPVVARPPRVTSSRRSPAPPAPAPMLAGDHLESIPVVDIGGTPVHLVDERQARMAIMRATHRTTEPPLGVASINLDHVHHFAQGSPASGAGVRWLNLIDGAPIARQTARVTGVAYPRLAGSDIIAGILTDLAGRGLSVGFVGGSPDLDFALRRRLADGWPGLRFAGHWAPPREVIGSPDQCHRLCDEIRAASPDVLVVCLGKPRQEQWIADYGAESGASVLLAFGAVVDFLAGRVTRAPQWVSRAGAEWMWRLALEPKRLARRYLIEGPPAYVAVRRSSSSPHRA